MENKEIINFGFGVEIGKDDSNDKYKIINKFAEWRYAK